MHPLVHMFVLTQQPLLGRETGIWVRELGHRELHMSPGLVEEMSQPWDASVT